MKFVRKMVQTTATILFMFWLLCHTSYAADILFIDRSSAEPSVAEQQVEIASRFYGLDFAILKVDGTDGNPKGVVAYIDQNKFQAIIVAANALESLNASQILNTIRKKNRPIPIMITGVTPENGKGFLNTWSGGTVESYSDIKEPLSDGYYRFSDLKDITRELSGQDIPFHVEIPISNGLRIEQGGAVQPIIAVINNKGENITPGFVKTSYGKHEVFIQTEIHAPKLQEKSVLNGISDRFIELAPLLMFLRYSFGKRCWHSPGRYANLTIDDPWLTEPYGHLSFKGLLNEMHKARFHTTTGFIPWNFDRSKPEVVQLFREHPDKFSISFHGNNHDHREFYKYKTSLDDPWSAKALSVHEANIKQALARMEEFNRLTGLSYDRIMVFPHSIGPEKTLGLLKKYNFLATVNTGNTPLGSSEPKDPLFYLRSFTLAFENFVSINRYSAKMSKANIAVHLFLDNPIIFSGHHDLFANGIDAFNKTAEFINIVDPDVEWCSQGCIARHLYLQRIRDDNNYDILSFSKSIELKNSHKRNVTYFVKKEESFNIPIKQVVVNGMPYPYQKSGDYLITTVSIPPGELRLVEVEYGNESNISSVSLKKSNLRVNLLRKLSDLRDIRISKNPFGRIFVKYYYDDTGFYQFGFNAIIIFLVVLATLIICIGLYVVKRKRKNVSP
jgi:hypothetical protein